jgi:DNA-directed RNA polymerase alpha subunit
MDVISIDELNLCVKTSNALKAHGVFTISDLKSKSIGWLFKTKDFLDKNAVHNILIKMAEENVMFDEV